MKYPQLTKQQGNLFLSNRISLAAKGVLIMLISHPEQQATTEELLSLACYDGSAREAVKELAKADIVTITPSPISHFAPATVLLLPPYTSDATDALRAYRDKEKT